MKQNRALTCKLLSSIEEAPGSLQLCSLLFDSCSLHSMQACCSTCCHGQGCDAQTCSLLSLIMPDACRPALTMCMTTAWLSRNGPGMLTGSQAVAEADGNALHTCVSISCVLLVVPRCTPPFLTACCSTQSACFGHMVLSGAVSKADTSAAVRMKCSWQCNQMVDVQDPCVSQLGKTKHCNVWSGLLRTMMRGQSLGGWCSCVCGLSTLL